MTTDEHLLRAWVTQGDPASFADLAERHAALVYGTCRRITGDPHAAEDLTQEVLLDLARRAVRVRRSAAGFLHAAARSRALNHCRDRETRR
ncbi:MAG: RNA polymerase sigma factor [Planctomycetota bacterium]